MTKARLEAFTDAILAIIMTLLVLELQMPHSASWVALWDIREEFLIYSMSFFFLAIYWVNHHHMLQLVETINGSILWSNIVMLFFMSLVPFATKWVGAHMLSFVPCMCYGLLFLLINISYALLSSVLLAAHDHESVYRHVFANDSRMTITLLISLVSLAAGFIHPSLILLGEMGVAGVNIVPSKHVEKCLNDGQCEWQAPEDTKNNRE